MIRLLAAAMLAATPPAAAQANDALLLAEMQRVEEARSAAIAAGDGAALERLYAPDFEGITSGGALVDRRVLFTLLARGKGGSATTRVESVRRSGDTVIVRGVLAIGEGSSTYLHIYEHGADGWRMVRGIAVPVASR